MIDKKSFKKDYFLRFLLIRNIIIFRDVSYIRTIFIKFGGVPNTPSDKLSVPITDTAFSKFIGQLRSSQIARLRPALKSPWRVAPEVHLNQLPFRLPITPLIDEVLEV